MKKYHKNGKNLKNKNFDLFFFVFFLKKNFFKKFQKKNGPPVDSIFQGLSEYIRLIF